MYKLIFFLVSILGGFHEIAAASQHINKDLTGHYNSRFHFYDEPYNMDFTYHNYDQMSRLLRTTSRRYQNLTALYSIGKSVNGTFLKRKRQIVRIIFSYYNYIYKCQLLFIIIQYYYLLSC